MPKVEKFKCALKSIIVNCIILEEIAAKGAAADESELKRLREQTSAQIPYIKQLPTAAKIAKVIKQRRRRRQKLKKKNKSIKDTVDPIVPLLPTFEEPPSRPKNIFLQKRHNALRYLSITECLVRLHLARSQDVETTKSFSDKLSKIRNEWMQQLEKDELVIHTLEQQWDEVHFGEAQQKESSTPKDLLRNRTIWDSYFISDESGSSIPLGWSLPPQEPTQQWQQYKLGDPGN